jgi:hypothetical protein
MASRARARVLRSKVTGRARSGGVMSERNGRQYLAWSNSLTRVLNHIDLKGAADKPPALKDYLAGRPAQAPAAA